MGLFAHAEQFSDEGRQGSRGAEKNDLHGEPSFLRVFAEKSRTLSVYAVWPCRGRHLRILEDAVDNYGTLW